MHVRAVCGPDIAEIAVSVMSKDKEILDSIADKEYEHGFVTDVEQEFIPKGLNEDIIRLISAKKEEPEWMLEFRLEAFRRCRRCLCRHGRIWTFLR